MNNIKAPLHDNEKTQLASFDSKVTKTNFNKLQLIGKKIADRYLIEKLIGQGGMNYIYRARDTFLETSQRTEHPVVIKLLQEEFSASPQAISLLKDETARTQQLSHPNIVKVYSAGTDNEYNYVVMEWVEGETLEQLIKRNKPSGLTFTKAKTILNQLLDALIYAHSNGIIHNDLKPSNIMFDSNGKLKVLDFGIAKQRTDEDKYAFKNKNEENTVGGYTPAYASPEQLNGNEATVKDDIFSFACITYELLSSKHPYDRVASNTIKVDTPIKKAINCPLSFWFTVKQGLSIDPNKRSDSLTVFHKSLNTNYKLPLGVAIVAALIGISGSLMYNENSDQTLQLQVQLENAVAINNQIETWMTWRDKSLLERLPEIPPQYDILKQGLLKKNQTVILNSFEQKAETFDNQINGFKDYDQVINTYNDALNYYPDSNTLAEKISSIVRERQSIIMDTTNRINLLLEQSRYNETGQNSIFSLINDLHSVDDEYVYTPTQQHFDNFKSAIEVALNTDNYVKQKSLLDVGKAAFLSVKGSQPIISSLQVREAAINSLAQYDKKVIAGEQVKYPAADAEIFYEPRFSRYNAELSSVTNYKELIKLEDKIVEESTLLPRNFTPLITIKKQLSKRYISMVNSLLKRRMYKTAETLIERSDAIVNSLDLLQ